jgi:hypothetical protein
MNDYNPNSRSLIKFDLDNMNSLIDNAYEIVDATAYFYIEQNSTSTGEIRLRARRIKRYWTDTATTWIKSNINTAWQQRGATGSNDRTNQFKTITVQQSQTGWISLDVLDWVKWAFVNDEYYGFIIEVDSHSPSLGSIGLATSESKSGTHRPYIEIDFYRSSLSSSSVSSSSTSSSSSSSA